MKWALVTIAIGVAMLVIFTQFMGMKAWVALAFFGISLSPIDRHDSRSRRVGHPSRDILRAPTADTRDAAELSLLGKASSDRDGEHVLVQPLLPISIRCPTQAEALKWPKASRCPSAE